MGPVFRSLVAGLLLVAACQAQAAIPQTMSYQGLLLAADGTPVPDGPYDLTFRIYDVPAGPDAPLWSEAQAAIPVARGIFSVLLGSGSPLGLAFDRPYWLGIAVGAGDELTPRVPLASSPYCLNAQSIVDGAVTAPKVASGQLVKSLNGLRDDVTLAAGSNIVITPAGQTLTLSATGGGFALPFASSQSSDGTLFDVSNTGAGGAGSFQVGNQSANPALYAKSTGTGAALVADGLTHIGSTTRSGDLNIFMGGRLNPVWRAYASGGGGTMYLSDEEGNPISTVGADWDGTGGFFNLYRDATHVGLYCDANSQGTGNPILVVQGAARSATFDMNATGDASVVLPVGSVGAGETADEPGAASATEGVASTALDGTAQILISRSINAPAAGYVLAIATCQATASHTNATLSAATFGVSDVAGSLPVNQDVVAQLSGSAPTGTFSFPVTVHGLFSVPAGASTIYFIGEEGSGSWNVWDLQLTLVFLPTAYGTVTSTMAGGAGESESTAGTRSGPGPAEIAAEREASLASDAERIKREMAAMRAQLEELRRTVEEATRRQAQAAARTPREAP